MNTNPILNSTFSGEKTHILNGAPMTAAGVFNKLAFLAILMSLSGGAVWYQFVIGNVDKVNLLMWAGLIVGFILSIVMLFARKAAPFITPVYAFAQGAFLAGISCFFEAMFPGIVVKAVALTFITIFAMYTLYATKIIKVTDKLKSIIITMTVSVGIFYGISLLLLLFNINIPLLYASDPLSIGFSIFVTGLAAFNLLLDFDFIETASKNFFPKEYEWLGAYGLLATIVWMYIEIIRLLSKLQKN